MLRQIISADVDGWVCDALAFDFEAFLDPVDAEDGPRLGEGSEFIEGDDWGVDLLSSSGEAVFLFLTIASRSPGAKF